MPNVLASSIGIASILSNAARVPQGAPLVSITLDGQEGSEELLLRAGVETAEWAWTDRTSGARYNMAAPRFWSPTR